MQRLRYHNFLVDDFSRYCWFYPLKKKSDFFEIFVSFQRMAENQSDRKIKLFRSDGGGEFTNQTLHDVFQKSGTRHQVLFPGII